MLLLTSMELHPTQHWFKTTYNNKKLEEVLVQADIAVLQQNQYYVEQN